MSKQDDDKPIPLASIKSRALRARLDELGSDIAAIKSAMRPLEDDLKPLDEQRKKLVTEFNAALVDSGIIKIDATVEEETENGEVVVRGWDAYWRNGQERVDKDALIKWMLERGKMNAEKVKECLEECVVRDKGGYIVRPR